MRRLILILLAVFLIGNMGFEAAAMTFYGAESTDLIAEGIEKTDPPPSQDETDPPPPKETETNPPYHGSGREMVSVYCQTPEDWETCHVHYWGSASSESSWPGVPMTKDANGIWSAEIPSDVTGLLFNKQGDDGKTPDLTLPTDGNLQYVIGSGWTKPGELVEAVTKYYVTGNATLCGVEFVPDDANSVMTKGENDIWTKIYQDVAAGEYQLKITDGTWNNTWYDENPGTDAGFDNYVLTLEAAADVKISFDAANGIVTVVTGDFDETPDADNPGSVSNGTLYCQTPDHWVGCYVYWWGASVVSPAWPGIRMTLNENGIWCAEVPLKAQGLYFSNGASYRSPNLPRPTKNDKNVRYIFAENRWAPCIGTEVETPDDRYYYVVGSEALSGSLWDPCDPNNRMTRGENDVWTKIYQNVAAGEYQLKVTDGSWDNTWYDENPGTDGIFGNYVLTLETTADVKIRFDAVNGVVTVEIQNVSEPPCPVIPDSNYYLVGYINGANCEGTDYKFVNGKVVATFTEDSYVFIKNGDVTYMTDDRQGTEATEVTLFDSTTLAKGEKLFVPKNQTLTFTLVVNADGTLTLSYASGTTTPGGNTSGEKYYVAGVGALCGIEWKEDDANNIMVKDNKGIWFKVYHNVARGSYAFTITDGTWTNSWGGEGEDGTYEFMVEADKTTVVIKFDAAAKKVTVEVGGKVPTTAPDTGSSGNSGNSGNSGAIGEADKNVTTILSPYRVVGNAPWMGDWDPASDAGRMLEIDPGVYRKNFHNVSPGDYELLITKDGTWDTYWGDNGENFCFSIVKNCTITVTFTLKDGVGEISVQALGMNKPGYDDGGDKELNVYRVTGDAFWMGGWDPTCDACIMTKNSHGQYVKRFLNVAKGTYSLRITRNGTMQGSWGLNGIGTQDYDFRVPEATDVQVVFDDKTGYVAVYVEGVGVTSLGSNEIGAPSQKEPQINRPAKNPTKDPVVNSGGNVLPPNSGMTGNGEAHPDLPDHTPNSFDDLDAFDLGKIFDGFKQFKKKAKVVVEQLSFGNAFDNIISEVGGFFTDILGKPSANVKEQNPFFAVVVIGCLMICLYYAGRLIRRKRLVILATAGGQNVVVEAVEPLSLHDTEKLVATNPVKPSTALDQKMMESIQKLKEK